MRISEVTNPIKLFLAAVRANGFTARTTIQADNISQARAMLAHIYGQLNVLSVTQLAAETNESATIKPETPAQTHVKALADQAARLKQQEKVARAQIGLKKAQDRVTRANHPAKPH